MPYNFFIREVYPGLAAVLDCDHHCVGVIVPSRKFPFKVMFFSYADAECYYGMTPDEAVAESFGFDSALFSLA